MTPGMVEKNITVIADAFNPSVFSEYWLRKELIIAESCQVSPGSIFTPQFVNLMTSQFTLIVNPGQLIYAPIQKNEIDPLANIVSKLIHIPYKAVGINFTYIADIFNESGINTSRSYFLSNTNPLHTEFPSEDSRFGAYLSKKYKESRLKLTILPVILGSISPIDGVPSKEIEKLNYQFNFHHDLNFENSSQHLLQLLSMTEEYEEYAQKLLSMLES